ncbi:uncharacterized protein LOC117115204 isoform X2 [Anneissia japonica]|uniref:uncharacterized protein LOC117115204 isoform X2 n=1 Tax=Anneissia japonica TaxID=1529436 RepID=UPI0014254FC4|nr:uncharacterized protein LOC117115204 isoform X2 [Anneissia japonica]
MTQSECDQEIPEESPKRDYVYFYRHHEVNYCIDASESTSLGRFANDAVGPLQNSYVKKILINGLPYLCLYAKKQISVGEEIRYDYGNQFAPWRTAIQCPEETDAMILLQSLLDGNPQLGTSVEDIGEVMGSVFDAELDASESSPGIQTSDVLVRDIESNSKSDEGNPQLDTSVEAEEVMSPVFGAELDTSESSPGIQTSEVLVRDIESNSKSDEGNPQLETSVEDLGEVMGSVFGAELDACESSLVIQKTAMPASDVNHLMDRVSDVAFHVMEIQTSEVLVRDIESNSKSNEGVSQLETNVKDLGKIMFASDINHLMDQVSDVPFHEMGIQTASEVPERDIVSDSESDVSEVFPVIPTTRATCDEEQIESLIEGTEEDTSKYTVDNTGEDTSVDTEECKQKPYKKPYRYCIFCWKMMSKLSQHIALVHKDNIRVQKALKLPKAEKADAFDVFKKEGITDFNKQQARMDLPRYERERVASSSKQAGALVQCGTCKAFLSKKYLRRHIKQVCQPKSEAVACAVSLPASLLALNNDNWDEFVQNILSKFRTNDEAGKMCVKDKVLMNIGKRLWSKQKRKVDKAVEVRKSVMADMRRLASLHIAFRKTEESLGELPVKTGNVSDLLQRTNFRHLEEAVNDYTKSELGIKAGLKQGLFYLLKSASKIVKATYLMEDKDVLADEVDKFVAVLDLNKNIMFGDATYTLNKQREEKLRRPSAQPEEEDIKKLKHHIIKRMYDIVTNDFEFFDIHKFVELRDCVVARLTLFNARRGGEPSRLLISHWTDAERGVWLDQQQVDRLDPLDKALAKELKVGYQTGKGKHLVPVLFPKDAHMPLRKLIDPDIRSTAGVLEDNKYLFPSTNGSISHVSGWHSVQNVCDRLDLQNKEMITATKNRHRVSVLFALMDVPETERSYIYKHLGHTADTNVHIYQAPLAVKEITVVGKRLQTMDTETSDVFASSSSCTSDEQLERSSSCTIEYQHSSSNPEANTVQDYQHAVSNQGAPVVQGRKYTKWSKDEENSVLKFFSAYMHGKAEKRLPGKKDIQRFLQCEPHFRHDIHTIHTKVMNEVYKRERRAKEFV